MRALLTGLIATLLPWAIVTAPAQLLPAAQEQRPLAIRIDRPEALGLSHHRNGPWSPDPGPHRMMRSVAHVWDKPFSARLRYVFDTPGHDAVIVSLGGVTIPADYVWACWPVYGDGKGHALFLDGSDGGGEHHYIASVDGPKVDWKGWKVLWFDLSPRENQNSWGGDGNHRLDPPLRVGGLVLDDTPDSYVGESDLFFADVLFMTDAMKAQYEQTPSEVAPKSLTLPAPGERVLNCPALEDPPVLDGKLDDVAWGRASIIDGFVTGDGRKPQRQTRVRLGHRDSVLYVAFECEEPQAASLKARHTAHDAPVHEDECVELFLAPMPAGRYFHFLVNSAGARSDEDAGPGSKGRDWNPDWQAATSAGDAAWYVEAAIPLAALGLTIEPGTALGFNVNRENHLVPEITAWSPTGESFHRPDRFGELVFTDRLVYPTTALVPEPGVGTNLLRAELRNATDASVEVRLVVEAISGGDQRRGAGAFVALAPGTTIQTEAEFELTDEGPAQIVLVVEDRDGRALYRSRPQTMTIPSVARQLADLSQKLRERDAEMTGLKLSDQVREDLQSRLADLQRLAEEFEVRRTSPESRSIGALERLSEDIVAMLDRPLQRLALSLETYRLAGEGALTMPRLDYVISSADTMEKVFRDEPWERPAARKLVVEAARNEVEGVQIVVVPTGEQDLRFATVEVSDLVGEGGATIPAARVDWYVVGYVQTEKPNYATPKVGWWPDPLLRQQYFHVKAGEVQPLWINVRVPTNAKAGLYRGRVTVKPVAQHELSVPIEVRVWDFAVPKQQHLETCFPLRPGNLQRFYRLPRVPLEMYEQWMDFCLEHRISINLCDWTDFDRDLERLVEHQLKAGGSAFCLGYANFITGKLEERQKHNAQVVARFKQLYERVKRRGWLKYAYVYCHDEIGQEQFEYARELYSALKQAMPDLRLMQTFYKDDPISALDDVVDVWAPNTGRYRREEFQAQQAKGDQVWWYVCCGPGKPFANLMIEWPGIDHRLWPWQSWKFGVTGLLYWGLAVWNDNLQGEARWPEVPWNPATWRNEAGAAHTGDGQLLYPGQDLLPLSSVRLENLRDGIEDYEYLWVLRDLTEKLKRAGSNTPLVSKAEETLAISDDLVADLTHFTQEPQKLRKARAQVAELIQKARKVLGSRTD